MVLADFRVARAKEDDCTVSRIRHSLEVLVSDTMVEDPESRRITHITLD